jgi:hypothetical protein
MKKHVLIIVSVALASLLIGTMFSMDYLASGAKPPSVWDAINKLQSQVDALNATVIEQQSLISELQTQVDILSATKLGTPDYDSGWTPIVPSSVITFVHGLGTTEVLVYVIGYESSLGIHQIHYGGNGVWIGNSLNDGLYWYKLTPNSIEVGREVNDGAWQEVRVIIWKIAEP